MSKLIVTLERFVARFTDKILVSTELEKKDFSKFKIKALKGIDIILSELELDEFSHIDNNKDEKRKHLGLKPVDTIVGMVSRLESVKGPEYFVEAAHKVAEKIEGVKFLVAGEGSLRHDLEKQAKRLGVKEKIKFLGWREDTIEIIAILDILVQPSLNEAVGRVLIEAGACGVPVVATDVGGIPEIVKNEQTGILVPPEDPDGLARAIIDLLSDKKKKLKMGEEAKRWVHSRFSTEKMVKEISEIYEGLVKN